ncbi:MAG: TIGR00180 family glycosyltransferase [Hyphomicrobium sp.]|uniref:TIGR00180 family glycosyltransferase n=1 Tax=Hyphomicrobium sp. TaxID=82 RepID=UPI0025BAF88F|nr:TIGR00180 family glycosyltransferase [Hyphomicrobium sp.]MBZ0211760.1 TIGR00180 family glycosyltransferase [Hyphomicrobium sp.]
MQLAEQYSLIIPTYSRPEELRRLLQYLAREKVAFQILVLDSGTPASRKENAATIAALPLKVWHLQFPSEMPPFEKFWRGVMQVTTPFCSMCADDDIVLVDSLEPIVHHLISHPDVAVAHGHYFTFYNTDHIGLTTVVYASRSIDDATPIERLRCLFRRYEAVTYGVYRTPVKQRALQDVQGLRSLLGHELGAGAITLVRGKSARLPVFYYGRSLRPSERYEQWHPVESMLNSPETLFAQYRTYRDVLEANLREVGVAREGDDTAKVLDLIHLTYLSEFTRPKFLDWLTDQVVKGRGRDDIMKDVWLQLYVGGNVPSTLLRLATPLRYVRDRLAPGFKPHHYVARFAGGKDRAVERRTCDGSVRRYRLYNSFLKSAIATKLNHEPVLGALDQYV